MFASVIIFTVICCLKIHAVPVSQPTHGSSEYYTEPQQYLRQDQPQPQYISIRPIPQAPKSIYESAPHHQVSQQFIPAPQDQKVSQLLLPSAADRQVQQAAQRLAGEQYVQHVRLAQQQGQANEAITSAQRRAQLQLQRLQEAQTLHQQSQQGPQVKYVTDVQPGQKYVRVPHIQVEPQQYQQQYEQEYTPEYRAQSQARPKASPQQYRLSAQTKADKEAEEHDNNASYQFGFDVKDDLYTNYQNRKEQREGGKISGSYSVVDSDGFIRTVTYTADPKEGFKAEVVRKPTDIVVKVPKPREQVQEEEAGQQYIEVPAQRYHQAEAEQPQHSPKQRIVYQYQ